MPEMCCRVMKPSRGSWRLAHASRLHTVVDNKVDNKGVAARMELDFGDNM